MKQDLILPFLDELKNLGLEEMQAQVKIKIKEYSDKIREMKYHGESKEFSHVLKFYHDLKAFLYFLENKERPETIRPNKFQRFKWIAQKLVNKGDFDESVLNQFDWD